MNNEKEWKFVRKVLLKLKQYKDNPNTEPDVSNEMDYNLWLMFKREIPIEQVGKY